MNKLTGRFVAAFVAMGAFFVLLAVACHRPPAVVDAGGEPDAFAPDVWTAPAPPPQPIVEPPGGRRSGSDYSYIAPPGDAGYLACSNGVGLVAGWCPPSTAATLLPDGGAGGIWYENSDGGVSALPIGTTGQALTAAGGLPSWQTPASLPDGGHGALWYENADGGVSALPIGTAGQFLAAQSTGLPGYQTGYPAPGVVVDAGGLGSCSIAFSTTSPSPLNVSTSPLAVRDWFVPADGVLYNFRGNNITNHWKISGTGVLRNSFDFITGSSNSTSGSLGNAITITSAAGDDGFESVLSSTSVQACGPVDSTGTNLGWGYAFRVPADTFSRTLTIYGGQYSCDVTLTAIASDGSFVTTNTQTIGAGAGQRDGWTVTYNSARDGQYSSITVLCTSNHGSSASVGFTAALLE